MSSNPRNYLDHGWRPSNSRPRLRMALWLQVKVRGRGLELRPVDCTPTLTKKRYCSMWLLVLYENMCYVSVICLCHAFTTSDDFKKLLNESSGILYKSLFCRSFAVQLADFGLSTTFGHGHLLKTYCGSPLYASPEIVNARPYVGPEVRI